MNSTEIVQTIVVYYQKCPKMTMQNSILSKLRKNDNIEFYIIKNSEK